VSSRFIASLLGLGLSLSVFHACGAESYPNKPIRIITTEAGGGSDFAARVLSRALTGPLGQPVIVENRGGGATISGDIVARATADGYTLLGASGTLWIATMLRKTHYDTLRDFVPITLAVSTPNILVVHPSVASSVKELIALAKARPGELNYGSGATGAASHLAGEMFKTMAGINIVRIPYKGSGVAVNALLGNEVQLMFPSASIAVPHVRSGRLKALAVTSHKPFSMMPEVPTLSDAALPGYESTVYAGLFAPIRTPAPVVRRLHDESVRFLRTAEARELFLRGGAEIVAATPDESRARIRSEMKRLARIIKEAGIRDQ
jgi:tripartite-type tricarboxylate transporter receptor subunit TctC